MTKTEKSSKFKQIVLDGQIFLENLAHGVKATETQVLTQAGGSGGEETKVGEKVHANRLSQALLRGELTEEVQELVYRTYLIDRHSTDYQVISGTKAILKKDLDKMEERVKGATNEKEVMEMISGLRNENEVRKLNKDAIFENTENLEVIVIQDNREELTNVLDELAEFNVIVGTDEHFDSEVSDTAPIRPMVKDEMGRDVPLSLDEEDRYNYIDKQGDKVQKIGTLKEFERKEKEYTIKIERSYYPRFRLEAFTTKLVVRRVDENTAMLDFYVSIYSNPDNLLSKPFVKEVKRIMENGASSDIVEFDNVSFTTRKALNQYDMLKYEFDNPIFKGVTEFNGCYILHFKSRIVQDGTDLLKKFYSESMAKKYETKAPKPKDLNLGEYLATETYTCEECGKVIEWDKEAMDYLPIAMPRYADDEAPKEELSDTTEYFDIQMAEMTMGKRLCKECLKKYIEEKLPKF